MPETVRVEVLEDTDPGSGMFELATECDITQLNSDCPLCGRIVTRITMTPLGSHYWHTKPQGPCSAWTSGETCIDPRYGQDTGRVPE